MEKAVNLFWTSGWDSTYRLLELLLIHKRAVQPYYIIYPMRKTWELEIQTMDKIRQVVYERYPETRQLLLPTIYKEWKEIKPNELISGQYKRLATLRHLGTQYSSISRYAEELGIYDFELCIDMRSPGFFSTYVKPCLVREPDGDYFNYRLTEQLPNPDLALLKYFKFPIHEYTKRDLQDLAQKYNFLDILKLSWFCHNPRNQQPCGVCQPCLIAIEHGMRWRIPLSGRIRNFIRFKVKPPVKKILKPLLQRTAFQKT